MSTWTEEERTVVLDDEATAALTAMTILSGAPRAVVAGNLIIVGAAESLRRANLINEMRGDS